ncbi:N-formylglutamate amidohydrolase [Actibacterium sp. 188UL27-1]|uniref:N-formylglutamate amidohydrolase n=1 Tax=Actibacterium sp. 188UL27-1 TaxID=2786961 RepID=UPI001956C61D|nr:N-formylglutamate amidohydrolase [Actibacterium sp. 188UL27-1]MBM7067933.1 N-formylglutamate amidohydrolase [Actibacterium sp. 188UL27-1]
MTYTPYRVHGQNRQSPWLISCDHATNTVPDDVNGGTLGLPEAEMKRHIAFDPGAAGLALTLADALGAPAILSNFSRLVIDPNRGLDDPTLVMKLYDGTIIPANRSADAAEICRRQILCYDPYHAALGDLAARPGMILVSVHSFTPQLNEHAPRPWEVGVLSAGDRRLAGPLIAALAAQGGPPVGDNQPYAGHLPGDAVDRHALRFGRPNVLLELRQDVIATATQQADWAARLAPLLDAARVTAQL